MEPGPRAGRQALRGVSPSGGDQRAEGLGSRDGAAQLLRRTAPAGPGREIARQAAARVCENAWGAFYEVLDVCSLGRLAVCVGDGSAGSAIGLAPGVGVPDPR